MSRLKKKSDRKNARIFWMITGILSRSLLLLGLGWLLRQKGIMLFHIGDKGFDLAAIVMLAGGLVLMYKSVREIHAKMEGPFTSLSNSKTL
jgi:predicted tellurium resistance membrane protein TerC